MHVKHGIRHVTLSIMCVICCCQAPREHHGPAKRWVTHQLLCYFPVKSVINSVLGASRTDRPELALQAWQCQPLQNHWICEMLLINLILLFLLPPPLLLLLPVPLLPLLCAAGRRGLLSWLLRGTWQPYEVVLLDHGSYLTISDR